MTDPTEGMNEEQRKVLEDAIESGEARIGTEDDMQSMEERFQSMVMNLVLNHGMSKGRAYKYLNKKMERATKKIISKGKKRQDQLRKEGKLIDTSTIDVEALPDEWKVGEKKTELF